MVQLTHFRWIANGRHRTGTFGTMCTCFSCLPRALPDHPSPFFPVDFFSPEGVVLRTELRSEGAQQMGCCVLGPGSLQWGTPVTSK